MASIFPDHPTFRLGIEALNKVAPENAERLPLLLSRILAKIHESGATLFSAKEEEQLRDVLGLGPDGVALVVQLSAFIFETAAQNNLKAPALLAALADTGLNEKNVSLGRGCFSMRCIERSFSVHSISLFLFPLQCSSFAAVWSSESSAFLSRLRSNALGAPWVLDGTAWRLSLGIGSSASTAIKTTTAVFDFSLRADRPPLSQLSRGGSSERNNSEGADKAAGNKPILSTRDYSTLLESKAPLEEKFSVEFSSREELLSFFEKLDRIQQQIDALSS